MHDSLIKLSKVLQTTLLCLTRASPVVLTDMYTESKLRQANLHLV